MSRPHSADDGWAAFAGFAFRETSFVGFALREAAFAGFEFREASFASFAFREGFRASANGILANFAGFALREALPTPPCEDCKEKKRKAGQVRVA